MSAGRDALRAYIAAKVADGIVNGISSPGQLVKKIGKEFAIDAPVVLGNMAAELGLHEAGRVAAKKCQEIAADVDRRGFAAVWGDITSLLDRQYQRGVERSRKKR